ncbi:ABC transporter permease [Actinomadura macrotermitis]|uniref:ABC-2 type transporter transmembrane domain-containing protein n=1 Tax=Actinomadura macrotermitis TaxID=2585200 RepID=A0A7K0BRC3_9ACTN|nr:ABC transporter permease [Actinomadura macrotermitis]MQY03743.1 hypothetical protein [Actinomadura macrotermitis]
MTDTAAPRAVPTPTPAPVPPAARIAKGAAFAALFRKELTIYRRDPLLLIMLFAVPTVLTLFLAPALGGAFALSHEPPAYVLVGTPGPGDAKNLGRPEATVTLAEAKDRVARGTTPFALVREPGAAPYVIADPTLPVLVPVFLEHLSGGADAAVVSPTGKPYRDAANPYQQSLFGFALLNVFFAGAHAAQALHRERNWGTWNRVLSLGLGKGAILLAKMLPIALIAAAQEILLIGGGSLLVGIPIQNPLFLLLGALATGGVVAAAACLLAAVSANDAQVPQFNNLLTLLGGALAGALVPVALMPSWAQLVAPVFPQYWVIDLLKGATSRGASVPAMTADLLVLLGYTALFGLIGRYGMRWERLRHA